MATIYRVTFRSTTSTGVKFANTLHYRGTGDELFGPYSGDPTPQEVADELATHLVTQYRAMLQTNDTLNDMTVTTEPDPTNPNVVSDMATHTVELAGTRNPTDSNLAPWLGALVSFKTDHAGRSFRGRLFAPPLKDITQLSSGGILATGSYIVAVNAFATQLAQSFGGGSGWGTLWTDTWHLSQVVYSRTRRSRLQTPYYSRVKVASVDRTLHGLRSRKR